MLRPRGLTRPESSRPSEDRRTLTVVGELRKSLEELKYLPCIAGRIEKNEKPLQFDPHPRLRPSLNLFLSDPYYAKPTAISPPSHPYAPYGGPEG